MGFIKGMLAGACFGMTIGTLKSKDIMGMYKRGKKYMKKLNLAGF